MSWYYVHAESGCAFRSDDPPEEVLKEPCAEEVPVRFYISACEEFGEKVDLHPDDEFLLRMDLI